MLRLIKPKYFMPIHGEYRMQRMHMKLANDCGIPEKTVSLWIMVMFLPYVQMKQV